MSFITRRLRDVDIASTTNPGSTMADVVENIQENIQSAMKYFQPLTGDVNGVNAVFTLAETPDEGSVLVYVNGVLNHPGVGNDYTIIGDTITFDLAPSTGTVLWANYQITTSV